MVSEVRSPVFHSLYGLRISANIPVPGLQIQSQPSQIDIRIQLRERHAPAPVFRVSPGDYYYISPNTESDDDATLRVGMLAGGYFGFFYGDGARFAVERHGREVWADWPDGYTIEDACTYLMGPVIAFALRLRGVVCLHASAIAIGDQAVALLGVAGAGKSTTAAAFARNGSPVLSDDVAVLSDHEDCFLIQPGHPRINLWPDSVRTLFGSDDALPRITPTWNKRCLALNQNGYRFQAEPLPLGAIYILGEREACLSATRIEKCGGTEALMTLVSNSYVNYLLNGDMRAREFAVLGRVIGGVPVRRVRPSNDSSKILDLCESVIADARQFASRDWKTAVKKND